MTVTIHAKAAAKMVAPPDVRCETEPIRVAEALIVLALVRCETERIHAAAMILFVPPGAMAAGHTDEAIHRVMVEDHTDEAILCAMGDPLPGSRPGLVLNATNQRSHVMARCVRFRASFESEAEYARQFDIRFHVPGDLA